MNRHHKINILQVVGNMNRGGAETFLMNVLRHIDRNKFQFYFLCFSDKHFDYEDEIADLGAKIIRMPDVKDVGATRYVKAIIDIIKKYNIQVVHAHTYYNSAFSLIAARLAGVPVRITHSHNTKSEVDASIFKRLYFKISRFFINILTTQRIACAKDAGHALFGERRQFSVINNGIDLARFSYSRSNRESLRDEFNIPKSAKVLLNIARFYEVKNHTYLLDVFYEYHKKNQNSYLILVGDGPLKGSMEEKAKALQLQKSIVFTGVRSDTERFYSAADIFVMPSIFEGLPVVLVEAQANSLPCIVSESIDKDVKMNSNFSFANIKSQPQDWAGAIEKTKRTDNAISDKLKNGYNIDHVAKSVSLLYSREGDWLK